jgi:hypothetical protein
VPLKNHQRNILEHNNVNETFTHYHDKYMNTKKENKDTGEL